MTIPSWERSIPSTHAPTRQGDKKTNAGGHRIKKEDNTQKKVQNATSHFVKRGLTQLPTAPPHAHPLFSKPPSKAPDKPPEYIFTPKQMEKINVATKEISDYSSKAQERHKTFCEYITHITSFKHFGMQKELVKLKGWTELFRTYKEFANIQEHFNATLIDILHEKNFNTKIEKLSSLFTSAEYNALRKASIDYAQQRKNSNMPLIEKAITDFMAKYNKPQLLPNTNIIDFFASPMQASSRYLLLEKALMDSIPAEATHLKKQLELVNRVMQQQLHEDQYKIT